MVVVSTAILMLIYVITYGKILDWTASTRIITYIVIAPLLMALFIHYQFHSPTPYVSLKPLFQVRTIVGYFYMMLVMFLSTSTTLLTSYMTTIINIDNTRTYTLYVYLLPGYLLGAFICYLWFKWQRWRFRYLVAGGMGCFVIFFGLLYFTVSPDSTYEMLYLPIFFRGLGMLTLIIAFALFAVEDLNPKHLLSNAFFLILSRSVMAPVLASAFYSNMLYRLQQKYIVQLSENMTLIDPEASTRFSSSLAGNTAQGHGVNEALQLATGNLYTTLRQQATLLSLKEILGWFLTLTLVIAIVSAFIPFHKTIRVPQVRTGEDMV